MTPYEQGFMRKCAERGIDGSALLKQAKSTYGHELGGYALTSAIPYVGSLPASIGALAGAMNGRDLSEEELDELANERGNGMNYVPGVAGYRLAQRQGAVNAAIVDRARELGIKKVRPSRHAVTESLSGIVNPLNWVAGPIGSIVGATRPHRTLDEQVAHDAKPQSWKNLLVPGYGGYQGALRAGASRDVMENRKKKDEKKDESSEKQSEARISGYERGFLSKCAEAGVPKKAAVELLKRAALSQDELKELGQYRGLTGDNMDVRYKDYKRKKRLMKIIPALAGGVYGAMRGGNNVGALQGRKGALIGGLLGAAGGYGMGAISSGLQNLGDRGKLEAARAGRAPSIFNQLYLGGQSSLGV